MPTTTALLAFTPAAPRTGAAALPPFTQAITWGEALREALLKLSDGGRDAGPSACFGGWDEFGQPLVGHQHAAILLLALGDAERIDHALIHAPMGLDSATRSALVRLKRLWIAQDSPTLGAELVLLGERRDLAARVPSLGSSTHWQSVTPFVSVRHVKPRGRNALAGQVEAELEAWGFPPAVSIDVQDSPYWRSFWVMRRDPQRRPPIRMGFGISVVFSEPVEIPYGAMAEALASVATSQLGSMRARPRAGTQSPAGFVSPSRDST